MSEPEAAEPISAKDFVARELRADPDLPYAEMKVRAARVGVNVPPFLYGSIRRQLGLPPRPEVAGPPAVAEPAEAAVTAATGTDTMEMEMAGGHEEHEEHDGARPDGDWPAAPAPAGTANGNVARGGPAAAGDDDAGAGEAVAPELPRGSKIKSRAFQFALDALRISPDITFQDLKARAKLANLAIAPIVYGRAKALLGLVPTKPRRSRADEPAAPRSLRQVDSFASLLPEQGAPLSEGLRQIEQLVASMRDLEEQNRHLRNAVQAALSVVRSALEGPDA